MKFKLTQIGCDTEYGYETVILEDDQLGELTVDEIEVDSFDELFELFDDSVESIKLKESMWDRYEAEIYLLCGKY